MKNLLLLGFLALALPGLAKDKPSTLVEEYDDAAMSKAIERARKEVSVFLKVLAAGDADSFSVKAPITDKNGTEHFWVSKVVYKDGVFTGVIANEPGIVENVKMGQKWSVKKEEISDWMYVRGKLIYGGYTIDPLLPTFPKDQADSLRARLVR